MSIVTGDRNALIAKLASRGKTIEDVRDAIVGEGKGVVSIDTNHPAYPKAEPSPRNVWVQLHRRSLRPVVDPAAELDYLAHLADTQPGKCECRPKWAAYLKDHPPTIETPDAYFAWGVAAHNAINQRLGKPQIDLATARRLHTPPYPALTPIQRSPSTVIPKDITKLPVLYPHKSAEWTANYQVCRACDHAPKFQSPRICEGAMCSSRMLRGVCPLGKFPHARPGTVVSAAKPAAAPAAAVIPFGTTIGRDESIASPSAEEIDFPIDLVFLWVDSSDPQWQDSYKQHCGGAPSESRFSSSDELRYALRSVERFAPWVQRIHIVTSGQRPAWLIESDRVRIVTHAQILDPAILPTFCSSTIESGLHRIPDLAEHVLVANDDTMFGAPVKPGHFFTAEGKALVVPSGALRSEGRGTFNRMKNNAADRMDQRFGPGPWKHAWHQILPVRRAMLAEVAEVFADALAQSSTRRQRSSSTIALNNALWCAYALHTGHAIAVPAADRLQARYLNPHNTDARTSMAAAIRSMPHLLCLNNGTQGTAGLVREFLGAYYPNASGFEKSPVPTRSAAELGEGAGFLVVSIGGKRRQFLWDCLDSIRRHYPTTPIHVLSDVPVSGGGISFSWMPSNATGLDSRWAKTQMHRYSPFELTVYVDDDTVIHQPFGHAVEYLGDAQVAIALDHPRVTMGEHLPGQLLANRDDRALVQGRESWHYHNTGVVIFRRCDRVRRLFDSWHDEWVASKGYDQPALLRARVKTGLHEITRLPDNMNFVPHHDAKGKSVEQWGEARILHWTNQKEITPSTYFPAMGVARGAPNTTAIAFSLTTEKGLCSAEQYVAIGKSIAAHSPCRLLVFGCGYDSELWCRLNPGGTTVFVEDDRSWSSSAKLPGGTFHPFTYGSKVGCPTIEGALPECPVGGDWDVILIDGPRGNRSDCPGREWPCLWAKQSKAKVIFLHDAERAWERELLEVAFSSDRVSIIAGGGRRGSLAIILR